MEKKKAIIAMSGGVDSSVSAFLMQQAGYECIGATMKLFHNEDLKEEGEKEDKTCCSLNDVEDARAVAFRLGMPFYVFNFSADFNHAVIDRFVEDYQKGRTPNPCIECNRCLKFEKLYRRMQELNMDFIVTGHYARISFDEESGRWQLKKAVDSNKDQSYVLYMLTQEQLAHIIFPLGGMTKPEVRALAEEHGFINARKHDSQDICFVPDGDYAGFIERYTGTKPVPGNYVNPQGEVLGTHKGIIHYTIGQRKGLGIALGAPAYVTDMNPEKNTVTLGTNDQLFSRGLIADQVNLISCASLAVPKRVSAKVRYRQTEQPAMAWQTEDGRLHVRFDEPQRAITKGQAVVLYDGELVVGGGTIVELAEEEVPIEPNELAPSSVQP
ncbi:MAG: tRNA 2-thiouridine(34) synthase MnmA [Lachnospiraceae bacterium]|nr:tRNA 2-thiouridine(34) synthase MnmA [Lachnospiraceae bacterium]